MKISKYFLMAAAAMSLFACSNDDEALNNKDGNMTMIKLSLGKADTKGLEETAGKKYNIITDLRVEFFAADGRNLYVPVPEGDLADAVSNLNSKTEAVLGVNNVPIMATKVAVIANEKTLSTQIQTGNLNEAYKTKIMLSEMRADDAKPFSQIKSVLTGNGTLKDATDNGVTTSTVTVSISAVSSRIEIGKIRAAKIAAPEGQTAVNVKEFYVQGIYINRFYTAGALSPENNALITDRKIIANGMETGNYNKANYTTDGVPFMCDEHVQNDPALVAQAITNDANYSYEVFPKVEEGAKQLYWAYPTLATIPTVEDEKTIANVPHIVLKLKVLYDNEGADWLDRYVTVQAYKKGSVNGESVMNFERNTVYRIETLDFDINKLTQTPYEGNKTVTATIKVMPWQDQLVVPDWH